MSSDWRRVNELFHAALERPVADRPAFVATEAGSDGALCAEVLSLLEAHENAGEFLDSPPHPEAERRRLAEAAPADPNGGEGRLSSGVQIGNYRIERELGRGGMGVVYLAEDLRLARKVALKALAPDYTRDERRRERLRKEARAAARLSHPGIATVFALEEIDGDLYIAGEYVAGRTLREELDEGPLPVERLLSTACQVAQALNAAHEQGVVHRDLKPENIISAGSTVKVLDFGIARSPSADDPRVTEVGTIVGTPGYMSPEQIEARDVDFRSDIFSFGVLLYELATLVHPFEGTSAASTIARILTIEPCPPGDLRPLPPDFDRIVRRCLHKRPEDRYQSTAELVGDLEKLRGGALRPGSGQASSAPTELRGRASSAPTEGASAPASAGQPTARPATARQAARWWRVHQVSVVCVYALISVLAGVVNEWIARQWSLAVFFGFVAAAALNGTLRVHLLFTERHNIPAFRGELRRATPWLRASDVAFGLGLLALALASAHVRTWAAILLAAVAAGTIIVSVAVEPATRDAAFPRRSSGTRRVSAGRDS